MTLASELKRIKEEKDNAVKGTLIDAFMDRIAEHPENDLLLNGLEQAELGRGFIDYGRALIVPDSLKAEGFVLLPAGAGYHLHFDVETDGN